MSLTNALKNAGGNFSRGCNKILEYKCNAARKLYASVRELDLKKSLSNLYHLALGDPIFDPD